ncbi:MAG: NAD(P)H-dependent oxidoreductase subunit E, partial [Leptolyngbyaceae cyanobacterium bins.59]|nr:NAD(P)H-dependent oxidoreductase subunit E [Leptolyngbyaceae cyanobacterium bins.59]
MDWNELLEVAETEKARRKQVRVHCCTSTGCRAAESVEVMNAMKVAVQDQGLEDRVEVVGVGCMGFCGRGPLVQIDPMNELYEEVTPHNASTIVDALKGGKSKCIKGDPLHPFFARQMRVVREHSGKVDPERIEDYIYTGGYQSLYKVLYEMTPAQVVEEITKSGLRGRGGG